MSTDGTETKRPRPASAAAKQADADNEESRLERVERELAAKDAVIRELQERLASAEDSSSVRPTRPSEAVCVGEGYLFVVGPENPESGLPEKRIACCDESEAKRWYIVTTAHPDKPTKQVDPVKFPIKAKCLDEERRIADRAVQQRIAIIRAKAERGGAMTPEEEQMLVDDELRRVGAV